MIMLLTAGASLCTVHMLPVQDQAQTIAGNLCFVKSELAIAMAGFV